MNLVFVYNADSGMFNTLADIAHKIISPESYECNLCNLTHGVFKVRDEWLGFLKGLDVDIEFLHRDEFIKKYQKQNEMSMSFPAIFIKDEDCLNLWVDKETINSMHSTEQLMQMIRDKLQA